ncbi:hypothetical protein KM043_008772 [Ampulex compressa]|nr:hypothetical protein KM043_008772 [Ampulex compressa]
MNQRKLASGKLTVRDNVNSRRKSIEGRPSINVDAKWSLKGRESGAGCAATMRRSRAVGGVASGKPRPGAEASVGGVKGHAMDGSRFDPRRDRGRVGTREEDASARPEFGSKSYYSRSTVNAHDNGARVPDYRMA